MSVTFVMSSAYMWWNKTPHFPFGEKSVRGLLVVRALFGFFGLWCLYCKLYDSIKFCFHMAAAGGY
jgi:hypothetical protein